MLIPSVIYQIGPHPSKMQPTWIKHNPNFTHVFLTDTECAKIMEAHIDPVVRMIYKSVVLGAQRADLCRMGTIYSRGGFYVDTDTIAYAPIRMKLRNASMLISEWASFEFFGAIPNHPFVDLALKRAAYGIRDEIVRCKTTGRCCKSANSCIVQLSGPRNFFAALVAAGREANCANSNWIPSRAQCTNSSSFFGRKFYKCNDRGMRKNVYRTTMCGIARHADCRNSEISRHKCPKHHYSRSKLFFHTSRFEWNLTASSSISMFGAV